MQKPTSASLERDIGSSHSIQQSDLASNASDIRRVLSRGKHLRTPYDQRPRDSLDLLFDSRPSTRQTDISGNRDEPLAISKSQPNIPVMSATVGIKGHNDTQQEKSSGKHKKSSPGKLAYMLDNSVSKNIVETNVDVTSNKTKAPPVSDSYSDKQLSRKEVLKTMGILRNVGM